MELLMHENVRKRILDKLETWRGKQQQQSQQQSEWSVAKNSDLSAASKTFKTKTNIKWFGSFGEVD